MTFKITDVHTARFPDSSIVADVFGACGVPDTAIIHALKSFVSGAPFSFNSRYTEKLANEIIAHLRVTLTSTLVSAVNEKYSPNLGERPDLVLRSLRNESNIFFEIEFRPNVEKDLIKFLIGHRCERLSAAVLILVFDRNDINPRYSSMPQFSKVVRLIQELEPAFPLLVCGFAGQHT